MRFCLNLILIFSTFSLVSQESILTYDEFISIVKKHHPITFQAELNYETGKAYIQKARGAFDPKANAGINQKNLTGTQYYSHLHTGLKLPTWYGITLNADYNNNTGTYLNSELINASEGILSGGISITLGSGLFMDERRAELKQAKIYLNSTKQEQKIIINQLLLNASLHYWKWLKYYKTRRIYKQALQNAQIRFEGVKKSVELGDIPPIDSVEAKITVQNRQINFQEANLDFQNYGVKMSIYLWQDGMIPLELDSSVVPDIPTLTTDTNNLNIDSIINNHPEVLLYKNKIDIQRIDKRLMSESLKPTIDLKYNLINDYEGDQTFSNLDINNNKWGLHFSYPLFIRKQRADVKLAKIKIKQTQADFELKKAGLRYKIQTSSNNVEALNNQYSLATETVNNYQILLNAEQTLFNTGESSIFMINYREQTLIESQKKAIQLYIKQKMAEQELKFYLFIQ